METGRKAALVAAVGVVLGLALTLYLPKEKKWNRNAEIRIGAGDDISGVLMDETVKDLEGVYHFADSLESTSFKDC